MQNSRKPWLREDLTLRNIYLPIKVLFTGYLVVIGIGLMMAGLQIMMTHGMADGEFGLSVDDIVYSYYGNRDDSRLESKLNGTMKDKASSQDRASIVKWVRSGSPRDKWDSEIQPIFQANCVKCHGAIPGLTPLTSYEEVKPHAEIDMGASITSLTRVSHIHLFGISFIFFFICFIFSLSTGIPVKYKSLAIGAPFAFLVVDIFCWWLIKWYPSFAYLEMVAGVTYNIAAAFMILTSLYQMWILPRKAAS